MDFRQIRIPYEGREKYPSRAGGESRSGVIINNYSLGGGGISSSNPSTDTGGGSENRGGNATSFFAYLSKTNGNFTALELAQGEKIEDVYITGYRNSDTAQVLVGDISHSGATADYDISGKPQTGMSIEVHNNGTTNTMLRIRLNSNIPTSADTGTLVIPIAVNINDNQIEPYHTAWHDNSTKCAVMQLRYSWFISRASTSNYILDLSNQTAGVNCDSDGVLYENSIATLQCTATTYYNGAPAQNITYSANTHDYGVVGFSIDSGTGVMNFVSGGTGKFYWNANYPSLPIDIIAYLEGTAIATKTMTISRNYPGSQGEPATMWWIETDSNFIHYNPNSGDYSPSAVTGSVWKQVGNGTPQKDTGYTIYQWYSNRVDLRTSSVGSITAPVSQDISGITFALGTYPDWFEQEEVPVIPDGVDGGVGPQGPQGGVGPQGPQGEAGGAGESNWIVTLDNDNASINANADGTIPSTSIRPSCRCRLYYGQTLQTGSSKTFELSVKDNGVAVNPRDYDITLTQTTSGAEITLGQNFHFSGTSLPIVVNGLKDNVVKDTKTFYITKSMAGPAGSGVIVQWSTDGTSWHDNYQDGDLYMRQYVDGSWSGAIRVVGENGASGATGPQGPQGANGQDGTDGKDGADIYTSTIFTTSYTQPLTPVSTEPIPPHSQHTEYTGQYVSSGNTSYWSRDGYIFSHSASSTDVLQLTIKPQNTADFRIRVGNGEVYFVQSGSTAPQDWDAATLKTNAYAYYQFSGSSTNTNFYFKATGDVSVELLTPDTTIDTDWNDGPIPTTSSTIVEYTIVGPWTENNGVYSAPTGNNTNAVERIDFVTIEDGQMVTFEGNGRCEKNYDYMFITNPDITEAQMQALSASTSTGISMSANTIAAKFNGVFKYALATRIPRAGNHTMYIIYKSDGSTEWGGPNFKLVTPQRPMWFSMAQVENGIAGEWSTPQQIGYNEQGRPAVSYWLELDYTSSILDTSSSITPSVITAKVMKQVGGFAGVQATDAEIRYSKITRGSAEETPTSAYTSGITIEVSDFASFQKIKLYAYADGIERDSEEVDLLKDGKDGIQGRNGYAIRGPYNYYDYVEQSKGRLWCDGQPNSMYPASEKYLDIIYKDGLYYYCNYTYVGTAEDGFQAGPYWTLGGNYDFVAANLILASGASINFLTNNELYLKDSNNQITGGAAGGSGITFWAGHQTPGLAPFRVNASGSVTATTGLIGGWKYDENGLEWSYYDGVENLNRASLNGAGVEFSYEGAGRRGTLIADTDGISFNTEGGNSATTALHIGGNGVTPVHFEGDGNFYCEKKIIGSRLYDYPVKMDALEVDKTISFNSGTTNVVGSNSPLNINLAIVTTGTSSGTYFTIKQETGSDGQLHKNLYFNNDMFLFSMGYYATSTGQWYNDYNYVKYFTSGTNLGKWMAVDYDSDPYGRWTGIYGPSFTNKKGDTIYFSV